MESDWGELSVAESTEGSAAELSSSPANEVFPGREAGLEGCWEEERGGAGVSWARELLFIGDRPRGGRGRSGECVVVHARQLLGLGLACMVERGRGAVRGTVGAERWARMVWRPTAVNGVCWLLGARPRAAAGGRGRRGSECQETQWRWG